MRPLISFLESNILPELQLTDPTVSADLKVLLNQVEKSVFAQTTDQDTQTEKQDKKVGKSIRFEEESESDSNLGCKRKAKTDLKMMVTRSQKKHKRNYSQAFCNDVPRELKMLSYMETRGQRARKL